jgi:hypothetical protein
MTTLRDTNVVGSSSSSGTGGIGVTFLDGLVNSLEDMPISERLIHEIPPELEHSAKDTDGTDTGEQKKVVDLKVVRKLRRGYYGEHYVAVRRIQDPLTTEKALRVR